MRYGQQVYICLFPPEPGQILLYTLNCFREAVQPVLHQTRFISPMSELPIAVMGQAVRRLFCLAWVIERFAQCEADAAFPQEIEMTIDVICTNALGSHD